MTSKVKGQGRKVTWCVRQVCPICRERNVLETPKLVEGLPTSQAITRTSFKVINQRSRSPGWLILRLEVSYLPNGKAYELQTWFTDRVRRPVSPTSAMTTNVKGEGRDVTWWVWQVLAVNRERKAPETPKSVGRLPITWTIMNTTFNVKRRGSRSLGPLMVTQKVCHILWMKRPTNLKLDTQLMHEEPQHGQCHDLQSQRSWWRGYVVLLTGVCS